MLVDIEKVARFFAAQRPGLTEEWAVPCFFACHNNCHQ